jgi:hypothetical protein
MAEKTKEVRFQRLPGREEIFDLFQQVTKKIREKRSKSN